MTRAATLLSAFTFTSISYGVEALECASPWAPPETSIVEAVAQALPATIHGPFQRIVDPVALFPSCESDEVDRSGPCSPPARNILTVLEHPGGRKRIVILRRESDGTERLLFEANVDVVGHPNLLHAQSTACELTATVAPNAQTVEIRVLKGCPEEPGVLSYPDMTPITLSGVYHLRQ